MSARRRRRRPARRFRSGCCSGVVLVVVGGLAGCNGARPTSASLAAEPVLGPIPGEVELGLVTKGPQQSRIGAAGSDGVVERIVAVDLLPAATADLVQERYGERYGFRRVELGVGTPVTVELRGVSPTRAVVTVTASSGFLVPLYGSPDDVRRAPADRPTTVLISVVSRQ